MNRYFAAAGVLMAVLSTGCAPAEDARPAVQYFAADAPNVPFSPAVRIGDVLYLSGQIGVRHDGTLAEGVEGQTRQAMENIAAVLERAGSSMDAVFKCNAMLDDMATWPEFNKAYVSFFEPGRLPARSSFGADGLALGALLEIECLAVAEPVADGS